ncbi:hypothetical protein AC579_2579 [Pseudocercospora musae]|uniref:Uncharacterized protein n=1 Tax=Pseudocercospora musae TaxID=113226 RepID=A0A139IF59_9PEZI|nr:hypothetical protein AC579_2579 [Pseudocercospora musae]
MAGGFGMPTDNTSNRKGARRSFSIFRRAGRRHNSSKYDDAPSKSSGDDLRTFHHGGGKKITRPEPLLRSASDRACDDDWMGAGHEPGSPETRNNAKPLPAQSQASQVLNLFGGYRTGPSGTQQISTPNKASLYDPHRANEILRENADAQVNYNRPSSRNTSPASQNRGYIPYRPNSTQSHAPPPLPKDSQTPKDEKEKWVPRALLKAREFSQWDTAWQLEKAFELPHENEERISQKLRDELEKERTAVSKQTHLINGAVGKGNQASAWEVPGKARHVDEQDRTSCKDFRPSEDSDSSRTELKSNATDHTFSPIEKSFAEDEAQKKSLKHAEKLVKQASSKRSAIQKLEIRAKDEARSGNWTELQVLVAKIDKERTDLVQLEGRIATLQGAHPADDFLKTNTQQEASKKEVSEMMKPESASSHPAMNQDRDARGLTTVAVSIQSQKPASDVVQSDSLPPSSHDAKSKPGDSSPASLSPTLPAAHPLAAQEKTLLRDILECEHRISDWIGVVAKAVTSDDVLLKQKAWQYKTNAIPQYTKYVALRREELAKLRTPQPEPAEDPLELHEPTQLSDIEDEPAHATGQTSGRANESTPQVMSVVERSGGSDAVASHAKRDTVRWPLLEEKENQDVRKMQPQGLQASMWADQNSPSDEKDRFNCLDWAVSPTREQMADMPAKAAAAPDTPGLFSIAPRRRSKNITEEEVVRLQEATAAKSPPTPSSPPVFSPEKASFASGAEASPSDKLHRRSKSVSSALPSPVSVHSTRRPSSGTFASGQAPHFALPKSSPLEPRSSAQLTRDLDYSSLEKSYNDVLEKLKALNSEREYWERKARGLGEPSSAEHKTLIEELARTKAELSLTHDQRDYWMRIANDREEEMEKLKADIASLEKDDA